MRVMKNKVTLLSLAVAGLFATTAAQAIVDLDANTGAPKYASEISLASATTLAIAPPGNVVNVKQNWGLSAAQQRYVRFDLPAGVKWGAALTSASLSNATFGAANITLAEGGGTSQSHVVFNVTAPAGGAALTEIYALNVPSVTVTAASTVMLTYSLHETAISAATATPTNATRLVVTTGELLKFTPAVGITATAATTETVGSIALLKKFCSGAAGAPGTANCASGSTDLLGAVGGIATYGWNAGPIYSVAAVDLTAAPDLSAVLKPTTAVSVAGDFSGRATAAGSIFHDTNANGTVACQGPGVAGTATATAASYAVGNALLGAGNDYTLCVTANGTSTLPAQSFTGTFVPDYQTGYAGASASLGTVGSWVRDGAELQSPWFSFGGTRYISRFFFMNTGSADTTCTATILSETGNTITAGSATTTGFTIPQNGQVAVLATDIASAATVAGRAAVRFICLAPSANIQGRYVITDTTNGGIDSGTLLRPGTN